MKNLSKMPKYLPILFSTVIAILCTILYFILTTNIENVINTKIQVSSEGVDRVVVPASNSFELKVNQHIRIKTNGVYFDATIGNIENMNNGNIELTLKEEIKELIPNSTLEARIIYSSESVWQKIINR